MRLTNLSQSPYVESYLLRYNYRFLWHPDVRHINGLLTLTPEFSSPTDAGWIVIPLSVLRRPLHHLPWLFLHVFLHYTERKLNMWETESGLSFKHRVVVRMSPGCGAWCNKFLRTLTHFLSLLHEMLFSL